MDKREAPFKVGDRVRFVNEKDAGLSNPAYMAVGTVVEVDDPVMDNCPCIVVWDDPDWKKRCSLSEAGIYMHNDDLAPYNPAPAHPTFEDLTGFEEAM